MLGVDVYQERGQFRQHAYCHRGIVNERTGPAAAMDHTPDEKRAVVVFGICFFQEPFDDSGSIFHIEFGLDHQTVSSFGDEGGVSLGPGQQGHRTQKDGLSGTGLARNYDKTLRESDVQRVYQNIISYLKGLKHGPANYSASETLSFTGRACISSSLPDPAIL